MWRMFHFVATMSFQEFHFPFHNDRRSWRQHFLSMNRGGKADWFNDDLPFLLQGLGPSFCCIHQYWSLKILLVFVFQYGDFGGGVIKCWFSAGNWFLWFKKYSYHGFGVTRFNQVTRITTGAQFYPFCAHLTWEYFSVHSCLRLVIDKESLCR